MPDGLTSFPDIPIDEQKEKQKSYLDLRYGPVPVAHGEACRRVGIHRNTPLVWRKRDQEFQVEEALRQQAKREDDLSDLQEKHAASADLVTDTGEKMLKGLLIAMADKDGTLTPQAMAAMARDEDACRGIDVARKMILDGVKIKRVARDLPANGPDAGVRVGVAVNAQAAAGVTPPAAPGVPAPVPPPVAGRIPTKEELLERMKRLKIAAPRPAPPSLPPGGATPGGNGNGSASPGGNGAAPAGGNGEPKHA